jgi:hypothetical protein
MNDEISAAERSQGRRADQPVRIGYHAYSTIVHSGSAFAAPHISLLLRASPLDPSPRAITPVARRPACFACRLLTVG